LRKKKQGQVMPVQRSRPAHHAAQIWSRGRAAAVALFNDRRQVDGRQVDGRQVDGRQVDGRQVDGRQVDGRQVDGRQVDGRQVDGRQVDGRQVDGRQVDGRQVDGRQVDGRQVDGRQVDGRQVDDAGSRWRPAGGWPAGKKAQPPLGWAGSGQDLSAQLIIYIIPIFILI
jgi:hypothetical protein